MDIAGTRTDKHWAELQPRLEANRNDNALWASAFDDYHMTRIRTRYLDPIDAIAQKNASVGEGFAVVALFCTLIEFLHTTETGENFKLDGPEANNHEYGRGQSKSMFTTFLEDATPFQKWFKGKTRNGTTLALNFYSAVRCSVLHEARTNDGWLILNEGSPALIEAVPDGTVLLHRNRLKPDLIVYLEDYRSRLLANTDKQDAFIRKWKHLCQP